MPVAAAPIQHDAAIFWEEIKRKPSSTGWLQDSCRVTVVVYTEGCCCIPKTRSSGLDPAAITVTGMAWEKSHHPCISVSAAFLTRGLWVNFSSKNIVIGALCILNTGKTVWWQNKHCSCFFRSVCAMKINVHICETVGHRTMKILERQDHTQCLSTVTLKKVKSLILLKDLCRIYCHGDW